MLLRCMPVDLNQDRFGINQQQSLGKFISLKSKNQVCQMTIIKQQPQIVTIIMIVEMTPTNNR